MHTTNTQKFTPNKGKKIFAKFYGKKYARIPIKTCLVKKHHNIFDLVSKYTKGKIKPDDIIFVSEKVVAITQGRAFHINKIKPSISAKILSKFVTKTSYGIGVGSPWTMELALKEAGLPLILAGGFISSVTKPFGYRGLFYSIVNNNVNAIDGPCSYTIKPYNKYAILAPKKASKVAKKIKSKTGCEVVIIDANDFGINVLGKSSKKISDKFVKKIFADNPLGQTSEQTPICIVRKA